ncbi:glycoside hydrolase family 32 protein [Flavihumibacter stibioxidans]|uniref:Glycosyl hydrolase family 32 n=1 Tax=Flavihumibacter stibioxidans TaxID=1834163 RepID=A0ABR7MD62_9BACT|nr:glycoside hydrolase family 32 protein [Flavihumibacter stibioxidans]MBC6492960.1 glycosyl hydrolase family 32 [Flavihumibacter stibioxidans]
MKKISIYLAILTAITSHYSTSLAQDTLPWHQEPYRPQIHFSPKKHWVNDPNGMVYHNGVYHLFYQHYPGGTTWGPMHWGHATSKDLVHWEEQSIKLYPDTLGFIFSGSAVYDRNNTSGFGRDGKGPLVAIFTHHVDPSQTGGKNFQYQSLAYSNDEGKTWTKYAGNPVLRKPESTDFRDPKVLWYEPGKKWIMTLAVKDQIEFYSSPDLKNWKYESEFGKNLGAHGGVWECPDLVAFDYNGKKIWVLIVNLNPGAPNGGSGTQYFLGDFDGSRFVASHTDPRWMDFGPDNYAGITWSNTGDRRILIGWMSNWNYANEVPTKNWRNAMTVPRELSLQAAGDKLLLASRPVPELKRLEGKPRLYRNIGAPETELLPSPAPIQLPALIELDATGLSAWNLVFSNEVGEELELGFDKASGQYYIDRSRSGASSFHKEFAGRHSAPVFSATPGRKVTLLVDQSSIELFADKGLTVMTELFFPSSPYSRFRLNLPAGGNMKSVRVVSLRSIHTH